MDFRKKIEEKITKIFQYVKLEILFWKPNEFKRIHPELVVLWKKKFRQMIRYSSNRTFPIAEEFVSVKIDKICCRKEKEENLLWR